MMKSDPTDASAPFNLGNMLDALPQMIEMAVKHELRAL